MAGASPSLAKLSRPRLHDVLPRERLFALLDEAVRRPLVWLGAQPGAGKTTLVASYLQARKRAGMWYQVDGADADAASFVYHLRLAAQALPGPRGSPELPLLTPEYLVDLAGFARRFFRALFMRTAPGAVLVLDNFQEVPESSAFHDLVLAAAAEVPEGQALMLLSRHEPPPRYAPLLAGAALAWLDGEALRLTPEETDAIARRRGIDDAPAIEALQQRCHGWAAGLALLLARPRSRPHDGDADAESLQQVFGYFAQRFFDALPTAQQHTLMQLAVLPSIDVALAERLTGAGDCARLLESLYRHHLFTERRRVAGEADAPGASAVVYQFHALLRAFLRQRARAALGDATLRELSVRAGALLADAGQADASLDLYADAGDWRAYREGLARQAERWLAQGRQRTLIERLARLPEPERAADAWLGYWEGRALAPTAHARALELLSASHRRFASDADALGQFACGAAVVQTLWYARLGWSEIVTWVDRLEPLLGRVAFVSRAMELACLTTLHAALSFCRIAHPAIGPLTQRLMRLIDDESIDWNQRLFTATHLMTFLHNAAEIDLAAELVARIDPLADTLPASALNRAYWHVFRAIHDVRRADDAAAAARFEKAEALARDEGLAHAEFSAIQFHAYLDIMLGRADEARARLAQLERHRARGHADAQMNFAVLQTMLAQLRGDAAAALTHAQRALQAIEHVGAEYFRAVFTVLTASALADGGAADAARAIIAAARATVRGSYLEVTEAQLLLEQAYIELVEGNDAPALEWLAQGLEAAAREPRLAAYTHRILARKPLLLWRALRHGIAVDFARRVVRAWRVAPPPVDVPGWPWTLRVRTLGGFELLLDDAPIAWGRKTPKKTLALLKAVIARGGSASEGALIDAFWPDEDGDAAARSLDAAVHRLRGLLGVPGLVQQQGGQVSLDRSRVWVDAWAFERALDAARDGGEPARAAAADALALYRGTFLADDDGESWPVATRERLRGKFVQAVADHGARLEAARREEEAIGWYLRGLDADPVVEPFYQGLMRCYHRLDRLPEAVSAYRRLKQTLSVTLSLPPSAGTEKLYRSLRLD